jgi:hypothetical protein
VDEDYHATERVAKHRAVASALGVHKLSEKHRRELEEGSGIGAAEMAASCARTISRGRDLPREFSARQRRRVPGVLFTVHRPNGQTSHIFRPSNVDPQKPGHKYEMPCKSRGAPGNTLDVPPSLRHLIADTDVPLIFVEGTKKMLSVTTAARREGVTVLVVAISGVWNWMADGEPIPDMFDIPVEGRSVTIMFDSDMLRKPEVQEAAHALAGHLKGRGARVSVTYFRDAADGSKVGADDFFVSGGTFDELRKLTRPYRSGDFVKVRLGRDVRLRMGLEDLRRKFWSEEYRGMGGHSMRDVFAVAIEEAASSATVVEDGLLIKLASRPWQRRAKVSRRTFFKALDRIEESGLGYRDNDHRKADETGAFVLRANVNQYGAERRTEGEETSTLEGLYARGLHLRAPRLRWSSPGRKPKRGTVKGTRKVRTGVPPAARPTTKRLGKIRGAVVDALDEAGGSATVEELCRILRRTRARDFRRRTLPMLEETRIISIEGDVVSLTEDWLAALEEQRKLGRETEADERERARHRKESHDHRAGLEAIRRSRKKREAEMLKDADSMEDLERVPDHAPPELVTMLKEYIRRNPHRRDEAPGWFAVALWADLEIPKPPVRDVELALYELREGRAA